MVNLAALAEEARRASTAAAGVAATNQLRALAKDGVYSLAGADYPEDVRLLTRAIEKAGLGGSTTVLNDTFGALRAGTHRPWGVVLICGQGINAAAVAPDGRSARFDGVGDIAGDWGGGGGIGQEALAAAARGRDGRGPRSSLERLVPAYFGEASPRALTKALYLGRIEQRRVSELAPLVFEAAEAGDAVARSIVDRLADELVGMARALIRRLRLSRLDPEVVLAGGVFRTRNAGFHERLEQGIRSAAPDARLVSLAAPPVLGAALIGLDRASTGGAVAKDVEARLRQALERWDPR